MLRNKFCDIFHKVQQSSSCHQKYREILRILYNETSFDDFEIEFMRCIEILFWQDMTHKNVHVERSLEFAATFVGSLTVRAENEAEANEGNETDDYDVQTHPFLDAIIRNTLEYHNLENVSARYRSCQFIDLILRNVGEDAHIANDLWNVILDSLLERIKDIKPAVRLQAVKALARLQSPTDGECPVIQAFLGRMYDCSAMVRKEMLELIAPTPITSAKIVEKVRDSDHTVRLAAYRKCSKMGPKMVKLVDRQSVVVCGFNEMHDAVKRCFLEDTLPKWLSAYNGDFLKLLHALKVDAFAEDMEQTEVVCRNVLEVFFKTHPLTTIIEYLPIDENKVIPPEKLNYESALYWGILVNYLRKSDNTEDYLDSVIPELLPFSVYVERIAKENSKLEGWKYDEYQHILGQLLQLAGKYDLGDEVGRKALRTLIVDMLITTKIEIRNITEMISILDKMNPVLDSLTIDICSIISDIREPLVAQPPSEDMLRQNDFKLAELRVKINILNEDRDEAVAQSDYEKAALIKKQLADLNKKMEEMSNEFDSAKTMVKASQNDPDTLCRCLNILIGILSHPKLKTLTISLRSCKDEFIVPLCDNNNDPEVSWRVFKCIALCCTLDRQLTQESLKLICSPIIFYRLAPQDESGKPVLLVSIATVSDILRLYGTNIFVTNDDTNSTNTNTTIRRRLNGTKRLYRTEHVEDVESFDFDSITWKDIIDILMDMLDDERGDIKEQACRAVCELVVGRIAMSSDLMARLILKWFNPLTEKHDQKLQLLLGNTFIRFAQMEGTEAILEEAVIPVLSHIGNAPSTSPLADIDLDNALRFLSAITSIQKQPGMIDIHKNLAYTLCYKIAAKPDDKCVPIYIKMLLNLELFLEDTVIVKELINQAELILEEIIDKAPKRNVQKFVFKLNKLLSENANDETETVGDKSEATQPAPPSEAVSRLSISEKETSTQAALEEIETVQENSVNKQNPDPPEVDNMEKSVRQSTRRLLSVSLKDISVNSPVKRRKQRGRRSKEASLGGGDISEETILHTIIENDEVEMGSLADDDLTIQTPTTTDSQSSSLTSSGSSRGRGGPKKVIESETPPDSDSSTRRSKRSKKVAESESQADSDRSTRRSGRSKKNVESETPSDSDRSTRRSGRSKNIVESETPSDSDSSARRRRGRSKKVIESETPLDSDRSTRRSGRSKKNVESETPSDSDRSTRRSGRSKNNVESEAPSDSDRSTRRSGRSKKNVESEAPSDSDRSTRRSGRSNKNVESEAPSDSDRSTRRSGRSKNNVESEAPSDSDRSTRRSGRSNKNVESEAPSDSDRSTRRSGRSKNNVESEAPSDSDRSTRRSGRSKNNVQSEAPSDSDRSTRRTGRSKKNVESEAPSDSDRSTRRSGRSKKNVESETPSDSDRSTRRSGRSKNNVESEAPSDSDRSTRRSGRSKKNVESEAPSDSDRSTRRSGRSKKNVESETPSDSDSTRRSGRYKNVVSETSSDSDAPQKKTLRRSIRKQKPKKRFS